jgi:hypothetical protein
MDEVAPTLLACPAQRLALAAATLTSAAIPAGAYFLFKKIRTPQVLKAEKTANTNPTQNALKAAYNTLSMYDLQRAALSGATGLGLLSTFIFAYKFYSGNTLSEPSAYTWPLINSAIAGIALDGLIERHYLTFSEDRAFWSLIAWGVTSPLGSIQALKALQAGK